MVRSTTIVAAWTIGMVAILTLGCTTVRPDPDSAPTAPGPTAVPSWVAEWDRTVAAANHEGQLVVSGPDGEAWLQLMDTFRQEFPEITVEFTPMGVEEFFDQVQRERQARRFAWDVRLGRLEADVFRARDAGVLTPVRPMLFHGLVVDDSRWAGGLDGLFRYEKEGQWVAGFHVQVSPSAWVNRGSIEQEKLVSARDLLDPQWRGRVVILDPRQDAGPVTILLDAYGEAFVRELLLGQEPRITADAREQADWVIRGEYPIGVGYTTNLARRFLLQGVIVPVQPVPDGPIGVSPGDGTVQALDRAPHPNAQRLFVNWLLTPTVQDHFAAALGANSLRLDVHAGDPLLRPDPRFVETFVCHVCEDMLPVRAEALRLARELVR